TEEAWPSEPGPTKSDELSAFAEITKPKIEPTITRALANVTITPPNVEAIMDCNRYSTKEQLLRVTALLKIFGDKTRRQPVSIEVTANELRAAEKLWVNTIQASNFEDERSYLQGVSKKEPLLVRQLDLFLDEEGTIRCQGRIDKSSLPMTTKRPILLPARHFYTQLKYHKRLLNQFAKQWRTEYLTSLRESSRSKVSSDAARKLAIEEGEIVVLKNDKSSRSFWKVARVEELLPSKDGVIRAAKVRVVNQENGKSTWLRRPIQHLVPLEIRSSCKQKNETHARDPTTEETKEDASSKEPLKANARSTVVTKYFLRSQNNRKDTGNKYLVKWKGYSSFENTWEPEEHISAACLRYFEKPKPLQDVIQDCVDNLRREVLDALRHKGPMPRICVPFRHDVFHFFFDGLGRVAEQKQWTLYNVKDFVRCQLPNSWSYFFNRLGDGVKIRFPVKMRTFLGRSAKNVTQSGEQIPQCYVEKLTFNFIK
ncbi:Hypothetical predicted protein, partial [Paramuricea clavata]